MSTQTNITNSWTEIDPSGDNFGVQNIGKGDLRLFKGDSEPTDTTGSYVVKSIDSGCLSFMNIDVSDGSKIYMYSTQGTQVVYD
ncbi:MAG: hypothetical protein ACTSP4_00630 [Candidatus Hodarchaeales archaeon]